MLACTLISCLFGAAVAVLVWHEAGLLWAFLAYVAAGSVALLGAGFYRAMRSPDGHFRADLHDPDCRRAAGGAPNK